MESEPNRRPAPRLTHGGDWAGYQEEYGGQPLDFSANVSPLGVPPGVRKAIRQAAASADRYPDPLCRALSRAIAAHEGVPESFVLCGNGAADLIFRAVLARRPHTALITAPAFSEYETALTACGCAVRRHLLREEQGFRLGEDFPRAIGAGSSHAGTGTAGADSSRADASHAAPDMVFLCEPNNPTGVTSPRELLLETARRCRETGALLILDECFADFLLDPDAHSLRAFLPEFPNLLILKAFTKLYAMAGVRLGYALCADASLLSQMRAAGQPWSVSSLAQAAGEAALSETDYVKRVRALIARERPWLMARLEQLGLRVIPGEANYLLFFSPVPLLTPMRRRGILLRSCANYHGLGEGWYRTAVRTHKENLRLVETLREVIQ